MEVMLTALFHFEPPDLQKWNEDKATIHFAELTNMTVLIIYTLASSRLNNPVQSYTKEK